MRRKPLNPNGRNNGPWAYKIVKRPQRKQAGPREPKERSSKPMGIIRSGKQAKMGWRSPKKGISKWGRYKSQQTPKVKNMVIGPGKPKRHSKSP